MPPAGCNRCGGPESIVAGQGPFVGLVEGEVCRTPTECDWELTAVRLSLRGAAQTYACTTCGVVADQPAQMDPAPGQMEGIDRRPGLDFTLDDLTDEERRS